MADNHSELPLPNELHKVPLTSAGAILAARKNGLVTPSSTRMVDNMDTLFESLELSIDTRISDYIVDLPSTNGNHQGDHSVANQ